MLKRKYMVIGFLAFCLTATFFIGITTSGNQDDISNTTNPSTTSLQPYDPWYDLNDDGCINIIDMVILGLRFDTTGTPVNKTALLLELQSRIDSLNASLVELQSRVEALETRITFCNVRIGTPPCGSYGDLDLSPWIGARRALVYLAIYNNGEQDIYYKFREAGQTRDIGGGTGGYDNDAGASGVGIRMGRMGYVVVLTDASGKISGMISANPAYDYSSDIILKAYIILE